MTESKDKAILEKAFQAAWNAWESTKRFVGGMVPKRFSPPKMFDGRVVIPWQQAANTESISAETKKELEELGDLSLKYAVRSRNVIQKGPYEEIRVDIVIIDGKEIESDTVVKRDKDYLEKFKNEIETKLTELTGLSPTPPTPAAPALTVTAGANAVTVPPLS